MRHNDRCVRGALIRELRREIGLTQAQLATVVGCGRSTVAMWEASRTRPCPRLLLRLSGILGVPPARLTGDPDPATLRGMRLSANLRQEDVATALHLRGKGTYSDVERGRQPLPARWIPILAHLFDTSETALRRLAAPS
ncbi:helix-turn-helix transcriptional regulator [Streptomyces laurentii]|uniref:helix-turn-helix transcriptional regulator n=1 Tax=Streptomyces laurentii TaxID=39478 RepID=UPI0036A6A59F